jgi:hypothetical protein
MPCAYLCINDLSETITLRLESDHISETYSSTKRLAVVSFEVIQYKAPVGLLIKIAVSTVAAAKYAKRCWTEPTYPKMVNQRHM